MTAKAFRQQLNTVVAELEAQLLPSSEQAFACHALQLLFDIDDEDARSAADAADEFERSIAAAHFDDANRQVFVVFAQYSAGGRSHLKPSDIEEFATWWEANRDEVLELVAPGVAGAPRVLLAAVSSGTLSTDVSKAAALASAALAKRTTLRAYGFDELLEAEHARASRTDYEPIDETVPVEQWFPYEPPQSRDRKAVVAVVKAKHLGELERKYRYRLFERNVRYWLGKPVVNEGISRTLQDPDHRADFWYYNNGITIVCDTVDVANKVATVTNLQIVNGCQTTSTLGENLAFLQNAPSADVLVRFVATEDDGLKQAITKFTNKQNAVVARDLMGNDDQQARLEAKFAKLNPPWFYERKAGAWKARVSDVDKKKFEDRRIDNQKAAQAVLAYFEDAGLARARKRYLFVSVEEELNGLYEKVFPAGVTTTRLLVPFKISRYVDTQRAKYQGEFRAVQKKYDGRDLAALADQNKLSPRELGVLAREWIKVANEYFVGTIGWLTAMRIDVADPKQLKKLFGSDEFDAYVEAAYGLAKEMLHRYFRDLSALTESRNEPFTYTNWVKGNWPHCVRALADRYYELSDFGATDPLADIPILAGRPDRQG